MSQQQPSSSLTPTQRLCTAIALTAILPVCSLVLRWPVAQVYHSDDVNLEVMVPWLVQFAAGAAIVAFIIGRTNGWRRMGLSVPPRLSEFRPLWFPLLAMVLYWLGPLTSILAGTYDWRLSSTALVFSLALAVLAPFAEEGLFRGVIFDLLLSRGRGYAVVLSSVLFGLMHLSRLFYGVSLQVTLVTLVSTTCLGLLFAGLRMQSRSLWVVIVLHGAINLFSDSLAGAVLRTDPLNGRELIGHLARSLSMLGYGGILALSVTGTVSALRRESMLQMTRWLTWVAMVVLTGWGLHNMILWLGQPPA